MSKQVWSWVKIRSGARQWMMLPGKWDYLEQGRMSFLWHFVYSTGLSSSCSLGKEWLIWLSSWGFQGPSLALNSPCLWKQMTLDVQPRKCPLNSLLFSTSIWGSGLARPLAGWVSHCASGMQGKSSFLALHITPFASPTDVYLNFLLCFCFKKKKKRRGGE